VHKNIETNNKQTNT